MKTAYEAGDINALYPNVHALIEEGCAGLHQGPSPISKYTLDYQTIVTKLLDPKQKYNFTLEGDNYKVFFPNDGFYDLCVFLSK